ncbi:hypothetical protein Droror1_Dr00017532 [Drosera rotundifolia]
MRRAPAGDEAARGDEATTEDPITTSSGEAISGEARTGEASSCRPPLRTTTFLLPNLPQLDDHPKSVFESMEAIMTLVFEESEEILQELVASILSRLERDNFLPWFSS